MLKKFTMTQEQLDKIMEACKPVPYIVAGGVPPPSPQESANRAWETLGLEMGFKYMSVRPIPGEPSTVFEAEPITAVYTQSELAAAQEGM